MKGVFISTPVEPRHFISIIPSLVTCAMKACWNVSFQQAHVGLFRLAGSWGHHKLSKAMSSRLPDLYQEWTLTLKPRTCWYTSTMFWRKSWHKIQVWKVWNLLEYWVKGTLNDWVRMPLRHQCQLKKQKKTIWIKFETTVQIEKGLMADSQVWFIWLFWKEGSCCSVPKVTKLQFYVV